MSEQVLQQVANILHELTAAVLPTLPHIKTWASYGVSSFSVEEKKYASLTCKWLYMAWLHLLEVDSWDVIAPPGLGPESQQSREKFL